MPKEPKKNPEKKKNIEKEESKAPSRTFDDSQETRDKGDRWESPKENVRTERDSERATRKIVPEESQVAAMVSKREIDWESAKAAERNYLKFLRELEIPDLPEFKTELEVSKLSIPSEVEKLWKFLRAHPESEITEHKMTVLQRRIEVDCESAYRRDLEDHLLVLEKILKKTRTEYLQLLGKISLNSERIDDTLVNLFHRETVATIQDGIYSVKNNLKILQTRSSSLTIDRREYDRLYENSIRTRRQFEELREILKK
jgi:hypothetical protein